MRRGGVIVNEPGETKAAQLFAKSAGGKQCCGLGAGCFGGESLEPRLVIQQRTDQPSLLPDR